jgi:L-rhamnose mutarotase
MERLCFQLSITHGAEDEFDRRHADIWPDMATEMDKAGYHNYTLFRRDQTVVGYAECHPDIASAAATLATTDVAARWNDSMTGIIEPGEGSFVQFEEIWHLA